MSQLTITQEELFYQIYNKNHKKLFLYIKNKLQCNDDTANDVLQEIFFKAFKNIDKLTEHNDPTKWLYVVASNYCIDIWRKKSTNIPENFINIDEMTNLQTKQGNDNTSNILEPYEAFQKQEFSKVIYNILIQLPPRYYQAIVMNDYLNYDYKTAANILNISLSAYTSLLKRAREKFKKIYLTTFLEIDETLINKYDIKNLTKIIDFTETSPKEMQKDMQNKVSEMIDKDVKIYTNFRKSSTVRHSLDLLNIEVSKANKNHKIADFGSGDATFLCKISPLVKHATGYDLSANMIRLAELNIALTDSKNITLLHQDILQLTDIKEIYNIAFVTMVLHHTPNPSKFLQIIHSFLKPKGKIIINELMPFTLVTPIDDHEDLWNGFEPKYLEKQLKQIGFNKINVEIHNDIHIDNTDENGEIARTHIFTITAIK